MPEQLTFYLPTVPVVLPDKPPAPPKPERKPAFCTACGEQLKGLRDLNAGTLCRECIPPSTLAVPPGRICGELRHKSIRCNCGGGECEAIPW